MASFLKTLRSNGEQTESAQTEMRDLATRIHSERRTLEQLINKANGSSKELGKLNEPVAKMSDRLAALDRQITAIEKRLPAVAAAQERTQGILKAHDQIDKQLGEFARLVETATTLKRDLAPFMELEGPFRAMKGEANELKAWMADLADTYSRLREHQDGLAQTSKDATARLEAIEDASQAANRTLDGQRRRAEELEQGIGRLTQLAAGAADTKHQLLTLKSLADQVTRKVATLENQRDTIDRVAKDMSRLDDLGRKVEASIRTQEDQVSQLHTLATDVDDLKSLYDSVTARSQEIKTHQQQVEEQERATRQKLSELGEQLRKATERFDLEHRGLETVSHRIADLRAAVKDCEDRTSRVDASSRVLTEMQTKVGNVWSRVEFLMGEVEKFDELPERMRVVRADAQRLQELMQRMAARSAEIEKAEPVVDTVVQDLATLSRTHEAIKDALDQLRVAQDEMARSRSGRAETEIWLRRVEESVTDLQERVQQVDTARPIVESVQKDVERVVGAIESVSSRREFLDEMQTRLAEVASLGAQLDDRTKAFRSRLDIAEGRFLSVTKQAEEAERIGKLVATVAGTVAQADGRLAEMTRSITSLEEHAQTVQSTAERTRLLGQELEQRQGALERASEHLARASTLRQEAADAVQQLDDRTRTLQATIDGVEGRNKRLEALSEELEHCSGKVRSVEKGMAQFEEHLGRWEMAKLDLKRSLEQAAARQSTVDALQANIGQMFELAERTANDLRATAEAQREIRDSRASLDDVLRRLHEADVAAAGFEARKQEIEDAERRLARAEALLIDIQSSLEMLNNQKAALDQVIEQAGSLTFQVQHAEALIERLRKERDITQAVRTALDDAGSRPSRPKRDS